MWCDLSSFLEMKGYNLLFSNAQVSAQAQTGCKAWQQEQVTPPHPTTVWYERWNMHRIRGWKLNLKLFCLRIVISLFLITEIFCYLAPHGMQHKESKPWLLHINHRLWCRWSTGGGRNETQVPYILCACSDHGAVGKQALLALCCICAPLQWAKSLHVPEKHLLLWV